MIDYFYDQYHTSHPLSDSAAPPRCEFEDYFAVAEPQSFLCPKLHIYPQVTELMTKSKERAAISASESKPLHKMIRICRKVFPVADEPDFSAPRWLNPDFARIASHKVIPKIRYSSVTFADMEKVEKDSRTLVASQSQSYWFLFALVSQLKHDGFKPSDPSLFDKSISALSASFATQTSICEGLSDFVGAKRRESFLAHVSGPVSEPQKHELLTAAGLDPFLFDQPLLEKVSSQLKEDSLISVSASLSKMSKSGHPKSAQSASRQYSSPLEYWRPGPSGYCKHSGSQLAVGRPSGFVVAGAGLLRRILSRVFASRSLVPVHL